MAVVSVRMNGRDYQVACDDGQEEHLNFLANEVNNRLSSLLRGMRNNPGEGLTLLLTALMMADELIENKKEINGMSTEIRRLSALLSEDRAYKQDGRVAEMEKTMAITLEEIAQRIEKIADRIELS
jgi:cell division protein ZapA